MNGPMKIFYLESSSKVLFSNCGIVFSLLDENDRSFSFIFSLNFYLRSLEVAEAKSRKGFQIDALRVAQEHHHGYLKEVISRSNLRSNWRWLTFGLFYRICSVLHSLIQLVQKLNVAPWPSLAPPCVWYSSPIVFVADRNHFISSFTRVFGTAESLLWLIHICVNLGAFRIIMSNGLRA